MIPSNLPYEERSEIGKQLYRGLLMIQEKRARIGEKMQRVAQYVKDHPEEFGRASESLDYKLE